jgi:hypothetical protein
MFEEFKEVDDIKLPFPKLTIITGENIEISYTPAEDERIARRSNIQEWISKYVLLLFFK